MPFPAHEKLSALNEEPIKQRDTIFGLHPGGRRRR
jgi:hypothetical protein